MKTLGGALANCLFASLAVAPMATSADRMPITTTSEEARQLYLKGRDLAEKLRATDARTLFTLAMSRAQVDEQGRLGGASASPVWGVSSSPGRSPRTRLA